jgi:hypothetical protein
MSSLKKSTTKTETPQKVEESYVNEVTTEFKSPYIAKHPALLAMKNHYATVETKVDHLDRYVEVNPFE